MMELLENLSTPQQILSICFILAFLAQVFYFLFFFVRVSKNTLPEKTLKQEPVSVIICAKNEEKNLRHLIPVLMEQDYPEFELVVINDGSWDDSQETLDAFKLNYPNLHVVEIPEEGIRMKGKKFALTLGIKGAKYERLLMTDADCVPSSKHWIASMMSSLTETDNIVLGYSPYIRKKGLLNKLIRFDTMFVAIQYLSFAKAGITYMGVGRNLSYTKTMFFKVGGFRKHTFINSGDDDLFVNQVATKSNTNVQLDPVSHMQSTPKESWKTWSYQKMRHLSTAPHYRRSHKFLLALFPLTYYLLVLSFIGLLLLHTFPLLVISIFVIRFILQIIIFKTSSKHLGNGSLVWMVPFWELALMTLNPIWYTSNLINKPVKWN